LEKNIKNIRDVKNTQKQLANLCKVSGYYTVHVSSL
jgi:hypothetical protein